MSFILDALKKSETERQQQGATEFSSVPASSGGASPARWLWLLAALLTVNFAVLIGIFLRPDTGPADDTIEAVQDPSGVLESPSPVTPDSTASFEDQVANAIKELPAASPAEQSVEEEPIRTPVTSPPRTASAAAHVPTIDQLRLDGSLALAELHLDIHVYSDDPAERFVFINMHKHRENSRIEEGPAVKEITPDGVILEYQGKAFLLPRE